MTDNPWTVRIVFDPQYRKGALEFLKDQGYDSGTDFELKKNIFKRDVLRFKNTGLAALFMLWLPNRN